MRNPIQIVVSLILAAVLACSWLKPMDEPATQQIDAGLKRALATYGTARLAHGLISIAQGTLVNATPAGVGMTFSPGQLLAPIAEMLKQFSDVMLLVCVAFGVERLLVTIGAISLASFALTAVALGWVFLYWRQRPIPSWLSKTLVVLMMVRFAVPVTVLGSAYVFQQFMADEYQLHQSAIEAFSKAAAVEPPPKPQDGKANILDGVKDWWSNKSVAVTEQYNALKNRAENAVQDAVKLLVIFVLQTIIIPLLLLWGLYGIARVCLQVPGSRRAPAP